jgi:hypothetical protein
MPRFFVALVNSTIAVACSIQLMAEPSKVLKIAVTTDGHVTADGRVVSIEALTPILCDLEKSKGSVWYYREAAGADPHPNALKVLSAIIDHNLPVSLSTKPDYSDAVDDKGRSVPRQ